MKDPLETACDNLAHGEASFEELRLIHWARKKYGLPPLPEKENRPDDYPLHGETSGRISRT